MCTLHLQIKGLLVSNSLCVILFGTFLLSLSCDFKEPVVPSWDVSGAIPLFNAKFSAMEILDRADSSLITDSDGRFAFVNDFSINPIRFGDSLVVKGKTITGSQQVDSLKISGITPPPLQIKITEINPALEPFLGTSAVVPAFNFTLPGSQFNEIENVEYAIIKEDQFVPFVVRNNMPIPITSFVLTIKNKVGGELVSQINSALPLNSGDSRTFQLELGNKKVESLLIADLTGTSSGSNGELVEINENSKLNLEFGEKEILIKEAIANIELSNFSKRDSVEINQPDFKPRLVVVREGKIIIEITNNSALTTDIIFVIDQLFTSSGKQYSDSLRVLANSVIKEVIIINDLELRFNSSDYITFSIRSTSLNSTQKVFVKDTDQIDYKVEVEELIPQFAYGDFFPRIVKMNPDSSEITYPDKLKNVMLEFDQGYIRAQIKNEVGIPLEFAPEITFIYSNNSREKLQFSTGIMPFSLQANPQNSPFILKDQTIHISNMINFNSIFNNRPKRVEFKGTTTSAPHNFPNGFISHDHTISGDMDIYFPVRFKSTTGITEKDSTISFDGKLLDQIKSGKMILTATNKVPLELSFQLKFLNKNKQPILQLPSTSSGKTHYVIISAQTNANGRAIFPTISSLEIELTENQIIQLRDATTISLTIVGKTIGPNGPQFIELGSTDEFYISAVAQGSIQVNK